MMLVNNNDNNAKVETHELEDEEKAMRRKSPWLCIVSFP